MKIHKMDTDEDIELAFQLEFGNYDICGNCYELFDIEEAQMIRELRVITKTCIGIIGWCPSCDLIKISPIHILICGRS